MTKLFSFILPVTRKGELTLAALIGAVVIVALAFWGGAPPADMLPAFLAGLAVLLAFVAALLFLGWHLLVRPLPAGHKEPALDMPRANTRRLLALLVGIGGINLVVGGFWDEVWHRQYGIPFGEDLLWRPHLLIYSSILIICALAFLGLVDMVRNGRGTWQQRFRANPVVGLLLLVAAFLMFALPADPLWHLLYGEDISALSLPHIILTVSFILVMILAAAIQMSTVPGRSWKTVRHLSGQDLLVIVLNVFILTIGLQIMTTDWDGERIGILLERPAWLLPAIIIALATFVGAMANHALRYAGAATLTGLLALALRFGLLWAFDYDGISTGAWIAVIPPMVALDLWFAVRVLRRQAPPRAIGAGTAALIGMALVTFPLFGQLFAYPQIGPGNLLPILFTGLLSALGAAWTGGTLGGYLGNENKQPAAGREIGRWQLQVVPPVALVTIVTAIFVFVTTASPPVI